MERYQERKNGEAGTSEAGRVVQRVKRRTLLGGVSEYRDFYEGGVPIWFGTYNIRNGKRGVLESALRRISQANMDLGIFQETKITNSVYTCGSDGYSVVATDAPIRHHGRVAVVYWPLPRFALGDVQKFRLNVVGFQMSMGDRQ